MVFFSRHLDFNDYAHPDESSKIAQIVERSHNLHHPLLLLNSARAIAEATGRHGDFEFVKLAGRWCSVIFSSLGVALLVLACGRLHGSFVAAVAGVFLVSNPMVFELAHFFKEDPALLFGIALSLVAMLVFSSQKTAWAAVFLGLASACAASGKFVGALVVPFSIYIVWVCSGNRRRDLTVMLAACALGFFAVNLPMIWHPGAAWKSLQKEVGLLFGTIDHPFLIHVPHFIYGRIYFETNTPSLAGLLIIYAYGVIQRGFQLHPVEWVLGMLPTVYVTILIFQTRPFDRYLLPASALMTCLSAIGLLSVIKVRFGKLIAVLMIVASVAWQIPRLHRADAGFKQGRPNISRVPCPVLLMPADQFSPLGQADLTKNYRTQAKSFPWCCLFFNEEECAAAILREILAVLPEAEILAVDDCSTDGTAARIESVPGGSFDQVAQPLRPKRCPLQGASGRAGRGHCHVEAPLQQSRYPGHEPFQPAKPYIAFI